jgi:hydroxymethylbilane synthase
MTSSLWVERAMSSSERIVWLGTRGSRLARWQTDHVSEALLRAWPGLDAETRVITTQGDRALDTPLLVIGGKGVFTAELEDALLRGEIDLAVHSLKDLPTTPTPGLMIGAILERADPRDTLISRKGHTLATLPQGATVGTSSSRRRAQLLHMRPDLSIRDLRGNVDTRIAKALDPDGSYDAILLALAGVQRLEREEVAGEIVSLETLLPAPGQGALAVQCRDEEESRALLAPLNHALTALQVTAERALLAGLGGGCATPVAAYAWTEDERLHLRGCVTAPDGARQVEVRGNDAATLDGARRLGARLARNALKEGARELLEAAP